jgi:hypothetical protein
METCVNHNTNEIWLTIDYYQLLIGNDKYKYELVTWYLLPANFKVGILRSGSSHMKIYINNNIYAECIIPLECKTNFNE